MATQAGHLEPWNAGMDFAMYVERLELFLKANKVANALKVATALSVMGAEIFELLSNLCHPKKPADLDFADMIARLKKRLAPEPSVAASRYRFQQVTQQEGQTTGEFISELQRAASHCKFNCAAKDPLGERLRDQLIFGIRNERLRSRLIADGEISFEEAVNLVQREEVINSGAREIGISKSPTLAYVSSFAPGHQKNAKRKAGTKTCFRCGQAGHDQAICRFKDALCHFCKKKGHIKAVCRQRSKPSRVKVVEPEREADYWIKKLGEGEAIFLSCRIEGRAASMELDTGCALSLAPRAFYDKFCSHLPIQPCSKDLKTYTSGKVDVLGEVHVKVEHNDQVERMPLIIVREGHGALFGRNWLHRLQLNWKKISGLFVNQVTPPSLQQLLNKFEVLFDGKLGLFNAGKVQLHLKADAHPVFCKARPVPYALRERVEAELNRLVAEEILQPVNFSNWASPIVPVPKKDHSIRICADFKATLNPALEIDKYPLPRMEDLLSQVGSGKYFSKLDMKDAYLQLPIEERFQEPLTINTHQGLFRYRRLPFGAASSPAVFQRTMESVLKGLSGVQVYLDDLIIFGSSLEDHLKNLEAVFDGLRSVGLKLRRDKCEFLRKSVSYLGYQIDESGVHPTEGKVEAIVRAPAPSNAKELRSYLGLLSFYSRFLPNLSTVAASLNRLLGDVPWIWSEDEQQAFENTKHLLLSSQLLVHFDPEKELYLQCDASAYGVGVVLSHRIEGRDRPIAFSSKSLTQAQRNYSQLEKEGLAIIYGLRRFHHYLYGRTFTIITDHKPLLGIFGEKKLLPDRAAARVQRWALELACYSYRLQFRRTEDHGNCDALSRLPQLSTIEDADNVVHSLFLDEVVDSTVTAKTIGRETTANGILQRVRDYVISQWPVTIDRDLQPYKDRENELSVCQGCLIWGNRVIIPPSLRSQVLRELHEGHLGIVRTKALARSYVWWPNLDKDIENHCASCETCLQTRSSPQTATVHPWSFPSAPWTRIHVDFAGPIDGFMFLICVDSYSKWPEIIKMRSITSANTIRALRSIFCRFGLPRQIVSDNGRQFVSSEFRSFLKDNGIRQITSAPYHPASNGLAERFVRTFKKSLKAGRGEDLDLIIDRFLMAYRNSPHATTGETPSYLLIKRRMRTRLDLLRPSVEDAVENKQLQLSTRGRDVTFRVGERVLARAYNDERWIRGIIEQIEGPRNYVVRTTDGLQRRHQDQLLLSSEPCDPQPHHSRSASPERKIPPIPLPRRNPPRERRPPEHYGLLGGGVR